MKLAFIGIGRVGFALANNLQLKGHDIAIADDRLESSSVAKALAQNASFRSLKLQEAIDWAELVFLATPFKLNKEILHGLDFNSKVLVDCTNPVGPGISHGLESKVSGAEKVQEWADNAKVLKAYSIYGFENLENSTYADFNVKPCMLIAGNDDEGKKILNQLNSDLGFDTVDVGGLERSLHLEHMTLLWVNMVRANKQPNFTWAQLSR